MQEIKDILRDLKRGDKETLKDVFFAAIAVAYLLGLVYICAMLQDIFFPLYQ